MAVITSFQQSEAGRLTLVRGKDHADGFTQIVSGSEGKYREISPNSAQKSARFRQISEKLRSMLRKVTRLDDDIDALFRLPLAEFTSQRNALAARLKKEGRQNDAERVKLLGKPSVSAWAVNQLYWHHRGAFDDLIATGKRFRPAPTSRRAGRVSDMRDSLDARREALAELSDIAAELLRDAGHSPTLDTMRRVTITLEAMAAYALLPGGPPAGRLTHDVDPPSFESLASLMAGGSVTEEPARSTSSRKPGLAAGKEQQKPAADLRRIRQAKIAAAKVSLQDAKRSLTDARARAQSLEAAQKKANAEAREAEKHKREAEERLKKATLASEDASRNAQSIMSDVEAAMQVLEDAKRAVEEATKALELLLAT